MKDNERIEEPVIKRDAQGKVREVRLVFGPHHFVDVTREAGRIKFSVGATHHGISADASEVMGELEVLIEELKRAHPEKSF
jgi:hypothetical protein